GGREIKGHSMSSNTIPAERLFGMCFLAASVCVAQTNASLSGTVVDDAGKPVAASVIVRRNAMPPLNARVQAGQDGTFSISNLPAGGYTVCVQVIGGGYLDPCSWSPEAPSVQIACVRYSGLAHFDTLIWPPG